MDLDTTVDFVPLMMRPHSAYKLEKFPDEVLDVNAHVDIMIRILTNSIAFQEKASIQPLSDVLVCVLEISVLMYVNIRTAIIQLKQEHTAVTQTQRSRQKHFWQR